MTNFENLSKTFDNFVRKMRTVVRLNRFGEAETTDDVVVEEIGRICSSCCFTGSNFGPTGK